MHVVHAGLLAIEIEHLRVETPVAEQFVADAPHGVAAFDGVPTVAVFIDPHAVRGFRNDQGPAGMNRARLPQTAPVRLLPIAVGLNDARIGPLVAVEMGGQPTDAIATSDFVK